MTFAYVGGNIGTAALEKVLATAESASADELAEDDHTSVAVANENAESIKGLMAVVKGL